METEFIYWRHITPDGIKVEEISGGEDKSGATWRTLAKQVWCENGRDGYRVIEHLPSGVPVVEDESVRVSVTHTDHLLAIASLPSTPEQDLSQFNVRTALGVDAERNDRKQVLKIRSKFLSERELAMVPEEDLTANLIAWTAKEALYKAAMTEGLDFMRDIAIEVLPHLNEKALAIKPAGGKEIKPEREMKQGADARQGINAPQGTDARQNNEGIADSPYGRGRVRVRKADGTEQEVEMTLYTYPSDDYIVTLAYSPKCAKYKKSR